MILLDTNVCVGILRGNPKVLAEYSRAAGNVAVAAMTEGELFYGARTIGWTLMMFSILMILGVGVISIWDGFRNGFTFWQDLSSCLPYIRSMT